MFTKISNEDWEIIHSCLEHKIIQQNRVLLKQGKICQHLYFLESGSIRYFTRHIDVEHSIHFIQPPSLFTSAQSFSSQQPSKYGIQALDESSLWIINREDAHKLLEIPSWNNFLKACFGQQ